MDSIENSNVEDTVFKGKFRRDDINFYNSEIIRIQKSKGIFGIQLDERRIASKNAIRRSKVYLPSKKRRLRRKSLLIWRQIQHCAEILNSKQLPCWNIQAVGSDFDGIVNPIKGLWTSENIEPIREYLIFHANNFLKANKHRLLSQNNISAQEITHKVLTDNALTFIKHHLN